MEQSKLKNQAKKTKLLIDIRNYKKQWNYAVNLNKNAKLEYFSRYDCKDGKLFWVNYKPYLSNKHSEADDEIVLKKDGELILKNKEIANILQGIVKGAEPSKCDIRLVSRILWHKWIIPSLKEWRFWYLILTGNFPR